MIVPCGCSIILSSCDVLQLRLRLSYKLIIRRYLRALMKYIQSTPTDTRHSHMTAILHLRYSARYSASGKKGGHSKYPVIGLEFLVICFGPYTPALIQFHTLLKQMSTDFNPQFSVVLSMYRVAFTLLFMPVKVNIPCQCLQARRDPRHSRSCRLHLPEASAAARD
jgi:hypothetical protein